MIPNVKNLLYVRMAWVDGAVSVSAGSGTAVREVAGSALCFCGKPVWRCVLRVECNVVCKGKDFGSVCTGGLLYCMQVFQKIRQW